MTATPQIIGNFAVYQDRATKIWIVRDMKTHVEMAHCPTQRDAFAVARSGFSGAMIKAHNITSSD